MEDQTTIVQRIAELARERADALACVHVAEDGTERALRWDELDRWSSQLAAALTERGLGHGGRLAIGLRNSPELVCSALAAWKAGATPIPVRWDLPGWELDRLLEVIDAAVTLRDDDLDWIRGTAERPMPELPDLLAPHLQGICSSGSTGTPKIILSAVPAVFHRVFSTPMAEQWRPIPRPQTVLVLAPMYHINAFATLQNMLSGDQLVVLQKFDAARVVDVVERHRVTTFTATPTMLQRIADLPDVDARDLSSLVWVLQGAAPMPPSLARRWIKLIGPDKLYMAYGMTEAIGITALDGEEWLLHEGSVGRGQRGTEVRILGEDGSDLPPGEVGEIFMRAPAYGGSTYVGEAPKLRTTDDGFSSVGDMGHLDGDGYLYVVDRRVDLIISGGANVFPAEVESALIDHPKVADVVVIGLRDPEWGRRVHAIVEPASLDDPPTLDEVRTYAKSRLAAYKIPKSVEIVEKMPRSAATKVNRGRLVEERGG